MLKCWDKHVTQKPKLPNVVNYKTSNKEINHLSTKHQVDMNKTCQSCPCNEPEHVNKINQDTELVNINIAPEYNTNIQAPTEEDD